LLPDTNPKIIAKTMIIGDEEPAGNQSAKQLMMQRSRERISVFKRPIMSATTPAENRPKKEPALKMARIWNPKAEECPWELTYEVMYVKGTKIPHSIRKIPRVRKVKGRSLKTVRLGAMLRRLAMGLRGRRLRTRRFAIVRRKRRMKPRIRADHANPTRGKRLCSIKGKIIPPMLPEVMAIPVALPRRRKK
jgi:hypothetical protein